MKKIIIFLLVLVFVLLPLTVKADVRVNERSSPIYQPKIATNHNNQVVITWTLGIDSSYVMVQRFDSLGQRINANMVAYSQPDSQVTTSSVVMNSAGGFIINWNIGPPSWSMADNYVSFFDSSGTAIDTIKVNDTQTGFHYWSDMAIDSSGKSVCVWAEAQNSSDPRQLKGQLFNKQFQKIGGNFLISDTAYYIYMSVGMDGQGRFSVAYNPGHNLTSVCVKVFDNNGQLDTFFVADSSLKGRNPDLAMNYQGQYVVVWRDDITANIWAQIFDKDNKRIGSNFLVSSVSEYINTQPRVAINEKGNFVVIWQDIVNSDSVVYAQRYLVDGTKISGKYRVNDTIQARAEHQGGDLDVVATNEMIYFTWLGSNRTNVYAKRDEWFKRGDVNNDGDIKVGDVIFLINYLFKGGPIPYPFYESGNVNGQDNVNITDVVYLIKYLFKGGQPPFQVPDFSPLITHKLGLGNQGSDVYARKVPWYYPLPHGDVSADSIVDISDIVFNINYVFYDGPEPSPFYEIGEIDGDGVIDITDIVWLINYVFYGGEPPPAVPDFSSS